MGITDSVKNFFSPEAGQQRTQWLADQERAFDEAFQYYLGPTGIPDRVVALNQMFNPVVAVGRSMQNSQEMLAPGKTPMQRVEAGARMLTEMATAALPAARVVAAPARVARIPGGMPRGVPNAEVPVGRAVVRPDNVFRGKGPQKINIPAQGGDYAVRTTNQAQIDDMIASGLIRQKPKGYGLDQLPDTYFNRAADASAPTNRFTGLSATNPYALTARADRLQGYGMGVPLDELQHVWRRNEDGTITDVLGDLLAQNLAKAGR